MLMINGCVLVYNCVGLSFSTDPSMLLIPSNVPDFMGIDMITDPAYANYAYLTEQSVSAGVDMIMVENNYKEFIDGLTSLVKNKVIPMRRINDAIRRILRVKFILGLFENPLNTDLSNAKNLREQVERRFNKIWLCKPCVLTSRRFHYTKERRESWQRLLMLITMGISVVNDEY
nr:glycoside hydrolase family 3 C-terminal domain-containing protein [Tanacetum cinerariifolium]